MKINFILEKTFLKFIEHVCDLRRIRPICLFLLQNTIATALVASRLDYCNSLVYNITFKDITKLQPVQNCLAWIVTMYPCFTHSKSASKMFALASCPISYHLNDLYHYLPGTFL